MLNFCIWCTYKIVGLRPLTFVNYFLVALIMQSEVSLRKGDCKEVRFSGKTVSAFFEYLHLYFPSAIPLELPETFYPFQI